MVMIAMCLGLRISEIRALQWQDFDLKGRILTLTRSIVGRYVWNGGKTGASEYPYGKHTVDGEREASLEIVRPVSASGSKLWV
jgi:integrase